MTGTLLAMGFESGPMLLLFLRLEFTKNLKLKELVERGSDDKAAKGPDIESIPHDLIRLINYFASARLSPKH